MKAAGIGRFGMEESGISMAWEYRNTKPNLLHKEAVEDHKNGKLRECTERPTQLTGGGMLSDWMADLCNVKFDECNVGKILPISF